MGIPGLWDQLGDGQVISIAKYASDHFEKTGRPLRIAIDEAGWRFNNLNPFQVAMIREKEAAANPIEKHILYRIRRLLRFNVRLLFVFDGPRRPHKRGRPAGRIPWKDIQLLKDMLHVLKIPTHRAPAEAEAECAALQLAGKVDVVWSEDGDSLMFGCTSLITNFRSPKKDGSTEKDGELVSLYTAEALRRDHGIDQHGFVLFAMLCGGDYDTTGLRGCGPKAALQIARMNTGLASRLCNASQYELPSWRESLVQHLLQQRGAVNVPINFPNYKTLVKYRTPLVTTATEFQSKRIYWEMPLDEMALRAMMHDRFNFWTKGYLETFAPWFLVRALASTTQGQECEMDKFDIKLKKQRKRKDVVEADVPFEEQVLAKITFRPTAATNLNLTLQPPNEDWLTATKTGITYGTPERIECEIPVSVLKKGLGPDYAVKIKPVEPPSRKRKHREGDSGEAIVSTPSSKRQRKSKVPAPVSIDRTDVAGPRLADTARQRSRSIDTRRAEGMNSRSGLSTTATTGLKTTTANAVPVAMPCFKKPWQTDPSPVPLSDGRPISAMIPPTDHIVEHEKYLLPSAPARRVLFLAALDKRTPTHQDESTTPPPMSETPEIIVLDTDDEDVDDHQPITQVVCTTSTSQDISAIASSNVSRALVTVTGTHQMPIEILDLTG